MKQKNFVLTIPELSISFQPLVKILSKLVSLYKTLISFIFICTDKTLEIFVSTLSFFSNQKGNFTSFAQNRLGVSGQKFNFPKEKFLKIAKVLSVILVLSVIFFGISKILPSSNSNQNAKTQPEIKGASAITSINKEFEFPLTDAKGKEISKIKYFIESAELRDEIIIKGQRATSVKGRIFLIINLKITNNYQKTVNINTRDYIRLSVNDSSELLAPDIHNDPVEVQAISTKYTRVGFPINTSDKNLTLQVGEVNKDKESIFLDFSGYE
ncbi:MAG: hypothetical protein N2558_00815 [Patescibacteria group bacterium]|nr:hypothetical protein [Patescibacteria group bacterium]